MNYPKIYFLGIGGIGMSALARYFMHEGRTVAGYDRTPTALTAELEAEGARIHYGDDAELIYNDFRDPAEVLVVYTPAVPDDHPEMEWFRANGFEMMKRSQMLGVVSQGKYVMAVAGTHGKTTTTTLVAWLNARAASTGRGGDGGGSAFLGGIAKNFGSNLVLGEGRRLAVEADEFDRSFLRLFPDVAVVTSADADHLDIYGDHATMKEAFSQFVRQIKPGGALVIKEGVDIVIDNPDIEVYRYSLDGGGDFRAEGTTLLDGGHYRFDVVCPDRVVRGCTLGIPGLINVENAVAAVAMMWVAGFDEERLRAALAEFRGVRRRFDFWINTPRLVYMDDYAHHPRELAAAIGSVRRMFPERRLTVVFQPHLYTRTRDFHVEFAQALSGADDVVMVPIYPAREEPICGVDSQMIGRLLTVPWVLVEKENIARELASRSDLDVVVTFGAGNIENHCAEIAQALKEKI
ncbi:UDP-N-acetylmuramate--L-alanine ligase [Alistipes sp. OttesenSCG-928-B03]|nr:UDP-N-acetylmuramate--L-alanine ligase [Alistipes sp. OttesenSCG-928-B03]